MRIIHRFFIGLFTVFSFVAVSGFGSVMADDSQNNAAKWRVGIHSGHSRYTSFIGAELQKENWGFSIGAPTAIGVRYYFDKIGYRWFMGAHATYSDIDDDETKDGIRYKSQTETTAGLGMGYKWRWKNHWDLILSVSVGYREEEFENSFANRTDKYISIMPGLTFGYTY